MTCFPTRPGRRLLISRGALPVVVLVLALGVPLPLLAQTAPFELLLEPGPSSDSVQLVVRNRSDDTRRLYFDPRLAQVELRGAKRSLGRCPLVSNARPSRPDERRFVDVAPGEQVAEPFDLRFHCFGSRLKRLDQARSVRVRYRTTFRRDQLGQRAWTGRLGPASLALGEEGAAAADEAASVGETPRPAVALRLVGAPPDSRRGRVVPVSLELRGPAHGRLPVWVRPELFTFRVQGPGLGERGRRCQLPRSGVRPLPDFIDRLGRRRKRFDLARICPAGTFRRAGVYRVQGVFSSSFDGSEFGMTAWTGRTEALNFLLRIRQAGARAADPVEIVSSGRRAGQGEGYVR
jgi:hypothetical protein